MPKINQLNQTTSLSNTDVLAAENANGANTRKIAYASLRTQIQNESRSVFALHGEIASDEQVATAASDWLNAHVTPTGSTVALDDTLLIQGAASDAKATGEMIVINGSSSNSTRVNITTTDTDVQLALMDDLTNFEDTIGGELIVVNSDSTDTTRVNITTSETDIELAEKSEVDEVKNEINNAKNLTDLNWAIATLSPGTGAEAGSTTRIRSPFIPVIGGETVELSGTANCLIVYCYDSNRGYISDSAWTDGNCFIVPSGTGNIRILIRKDTSNSTISAGDIATLAAQCTLYRTLPESVYDLDLDMIKNENAYNLLTGRLVGITGTHNGMAYTWNGNTCTISGTASGTSYNWLDGGVAQDLPEDYGPGDTLYMRFQNTVNGVQMIIAFYTSSTAYISGSDQIASKEKTFTIPENAAKWRIALICASGVSISSSSPVMITLDMVRVLNARSNKDLGIAIDTLNTSIGTTNATVATLMSDTRHEFIANNSWNWLNGQLTPSSGSSNGITYSWSGNTCTIYGTATATATNWLDTSAHNLPDGLSAGDTVYLRFQKAVTGVQMMVAFYTSSSVYISGSDQIASIDKTFIIPSTAAKWRIALVCASGVSIDSSSPVIVTLDMIRVLSAPTNAELLAGQSSFTSQLSALKLYTGQNASIDKTKLAEYQLHFYGSNVAEAFAFFTDPHLVGSAGELSEDLVNQYVNVLEGTVKRSSAAYVVCGGDWLNISHTKENASYKLGYVNGKMNSIFPDMYFPVAGNHDFNYLSGQGGTYSREDWVTPQALRNFWFNRFDHCYYKFKKMTAMNYVLDTEVDENTVTDYEKAMLDWFAASLISDNPAHSTVFMHIYWLGTPGSSTIPAKVLAIGKIIQAFNAHTTCTLTQATEMYAKTYDFTGTTGHVDFAMCGHSHQDFDTTIGGVPCIGTTLFTDGYKVTFDMAFADYTGGKLYLTRFGTGSSRTFNI